MYRVKKCQYATTIGNIAGYQIENTQEKNDYSLMYVNRYLHVCAQRSDQTCRQYAYRIAKYLAYLAGIDKSYLVAEDEDIVHYMHSLQYELDDRVVAIRQKISPHALAAAYNPIRGLYIYLHECKIPINVTIKDCQSHVLRDRYLASIAPALPKPDIVLEQSWELGANRREYLRWYTDGQKEALLAACRTLRDRAIVSISLDGFRIDEILSSRREDYDQTNGLLSPYRSKRRQDGEETRCAPLSERSMKYLDDYMQNEREIVEIEIEERGCRMPDELFVVLRHGPTFGQPLTYRSFYGSLKAAAKRAGFDQVLIRTHSGRSTRANEIVTDMANHPDKWTEKEFLDIFGWRSIRSAEPYLNRNDVTRQIITASKLKEADLERRKKNGGK